MFQFEILSGKQAGGLWLARRFPVRLGRSAGNDLRLEESGVYEEHAVFEMDGNRHLTLRVIEPALTAVNGQPTSEATLRNGDVLTLGSARLRLWLAPARQSHLRLGEFLLWGLWFGVAAAQLLLLRWLWQ
jgi:hypothetical protein